MLNRILVALVGIPVLLYILFTGGYPLLVFTNLIVGVGMFEFYSMAEKSGIKPYSKLGIVFGIIIVNLMYFGFDTMGGNIIFPIILMLVSMMGTRVLKNQVENSSRDIGITLLGVVYVALMFSHIILLAKLPNGGKWIISTQVMVWVCDSAAYFVGMNIGRKFFKEGFSTISPKKSKEGAIGGVIFTIIALFILNNRFNLITDNNLILIIIGLIVSLVAQIGDLAESMFKREFKIKDSGRILGEHGGILDRFDSMIFVLPTVYYIVKIFIY